MKIVLSGYYGFHNVGDEAILFSIIEALRKANPHVQITVLSNDPDYTKKTYQVDAVNRWKMKEVAAAIKAADGLISGGGSLLQDKTGNRSVIYYSAIMLMAKFFSTPFVVYAQGIGPITKKFNQTITKFTLAKAALITVRDKASKQFLEQIGLKKQILEVPDPVLGIKLKEDTYQRLSEKTNVTVSVRDWPTDTNYLQKIAKTLDKVSQLGYDVIFVPMHGEYDEKTSFKVCDMMNSKAFVAPYDLSIEEKISVIGKSDLLIGMRLHALIFAAVMDTPFTAISYDPKIEAFAKHCQQPVACHVESNTWSEEDLFKVVKQQLDHLPSYRQKLKRYADQAKLNAQNTAELTLSKFH